MCSIRVIVISVLAFICCGLASAQQLPKSGSIHFHTGWKLAGEAIVPVETYSLGHGSAVGTTFNDQGSGPLHLGAADCFYTFLVLKDHGKNKGSCVFGDSDGDRIFTNFTGTLSPHGDSGTNEIAGGTGKYAGIQGSGPWKCKVAGNNGELHCAQRLDYRLP